MKNENKHSDSYPRQENKAPEKVGLNFENTVKKSASFCSKSRLVTQLSRHNATWGDSVTI